MPTSRSDAVTQTERALLGAVLLKNSLLTDAALSADDFSLDSHQRIFRAIAAMAEDKRPIDETTLPEELARRGELDRPGDLLEPRWP
jgi:replicative DNA helicase